LKRTHKFGIELPKTVKEALELDKKNGNTFWADTIAKEMKDVCIAFKSCLMDNLRQLVTRRYPVMWYLTLKWKTFDAKPD
jgi:hypothetical protein